MDRLQQEIAQINSELEAIKITRRSLVERESALLHRHQKLSTQLKDERETSIA